MLDIVAWGRGNNKSSEHKGRYRFHEGEDVGDDG